MDEELQIYLILKGKTYAGTCEDWYESTIGLEGTFYGKATGYFYDACIRQPYTLHIDENIVEAHSYWCKLGKRRYE